ncbi:class I SAM-dependent methyltransferase [Pseudoalteromonas galatheae]|uniref:class I SAM-dependent methyltransferase n=1 Tax=Pseudoalteromonas galatheae TaxID=579562 RepID=UPI001F444B4B|nr:class I SAM-dependent methyltransferase [Pseudoalteromonas galatheae]
MIDYGMRARHYDIEYSFNKDKDFIASLVTPNVRTILDIPSGTGRNLWLAETGREIVFADLEPAMIEILSKKLIQRKKIPRVRAVVADMRDLDLGMKFDLIIISHDAFLMFSKDDEVKAVLDCMQQHLSSSGRLMIDVSLLESTSLSLQNTPMCYDPELPDGKWKTDIVRALDHESFLFRRTRQKHIADLVHFDFSYQVKTNETDLQEYKSKLVLRRYTYSALDILITSTGLEIKERFCDYDRGSFRHDSTRCIYLVGHEK